MHSENAPMSSIDFNNGENHVDVHVAERKEPSDILTTMLKAPPMKHQAEDSPILLPPPELLVLHAAFHAKAAGAETDFIQGITDINLLGRLCTSNRVKKYGVALRCGDHLSAIATLSKSGGLPFPQIPTSFDRPTREKLRSRFVAGESRLHRVRRGFSLISDRRPTLEALSALIGQFEGRKLPYFFWQIFGQFTASERFATRKGVGFLKPPANIIRSGATFLPFDGDRSEFFSASPVARLTRDYRFAICLPTGAADLTFKLSATYLDHVNVSVHVNGNTITRIIEGDTSNRTFVFRRPPQNVEISVRYTTKTCSECARDLSDMRVLVEF